MSTITREVRAKIVFADSTSRTYSIPIDLEDVSDVKTRAKELNNKTGDGAQYSDAMLATFVSDSGSPMTKIGGVSVVTTVEEVIFNG